MSQCNIKKFIEINIPTGACNMECPYCFIGKKKKADKLIFSVEQIRKAFSKKRLGGTCGISICSDGETLIHPEIVNIVDVLLREGHYVMIVSNGTLRNKICQCLELEENMLERLFFKFSLHYEELKRIGKLEEYFENINMVKLSPASFTVEYTMNDNVLENCNEMKKICMDKVGANPHMNIARDDRRKNIGVYSKSSFCNYVKKYKMTEIVSQFFEQKMQFVGKKYKGYCYAGDRYLWVDLKTGYSHQCYGTPPLQNFVGECDNPIIWLAIGNNCKHAYCYPSHLMMSMGITDYPKKCKYRPTYEEIRNRRCVDESMWLKPTYIEVFSKGVQKKEHSIIKKKIVNMVNCVLIWKRRKQNEV